MEGLPVFEDLPGRHARLKAAFEKLDPKLRVPTQALGRRYTIGCVAVEITQRCNLDCTLCYLSASSEKVKDIPLSLVLERLRRVRDHYGDGVSVQITGGDPTLRRRTELVAIVREAARLGLEPSLMTNGIKLSRDLALELKEAGLTDVAIHGDLTQERKGYATEESLNAIRQEYIERVRDVGLHVIFNTTVFDGNFAEIPALVRFFSKNADVVGLVSFQIQAATGRRHATALWTGRREIRKLTLIIHNFMDAAELDPERVAACSFMVATDRGFVSMCAHNAARETFIRRPLAVATDEGMKVWDPLTGQLLPVVTREVPAAHILPSALSEIPVSSLPVFAGGK